MIDLPSRPSLPRKPALPGGTRPYDPPTLPEIPAGKPRTDEHGLALSWCEDLGFRVRGWLARAYEYLGFDKQFPPSGQGHFGSSGTVPEIAFMGGLLTRGLEPFRDFEFQSEAMGGRRFPGGAVLDFLVYVNGLNVGVRVESVFHASDFVFAGQAKVNEDEAQRVRLLSSGAVDRVVAVNQQADGYPLEGSNDALADADVNRVMGIV